MMIKPAAQFEVKRRGNRTVLRDMTDWIVLDKFMKQIVADRQGDLLLVNYNLPEHGLVKSKEYALDSDDGYQAFVVDYMAACFSHMYCSALALRYEERDFATTLTETKDKLNDIFNWIQNYHIGSSGWDTGFIKLPMTMDNITHLYQATISPTVAVTWGEDDDKIFELGASISKDSFKVLMGIIKPTYLEFIVPLNESLEKAKELFEAVVGDLFEDVEGIECIYNTNSHINRPTPRKSLSPIATIDLGSNTFTIKDWSV